MKTIIIMINGGSNMYVEKRIKICFRVLLIISLTVIGISTSAAAGRKRPHVTRNNNVMVLEYDFDEPDIITEGDIDFVTIKGFERYSKAGAPVIPVKPVEILVPAGMEIEKVTSSAINISQFSDTYRLSHGTKPRRRLPYSEEASRRFEVEPVAPTEPDPAIFGMTKFWPVKHHDLVTVQTNRGYNIAHVNLFPLQYSPKAGEIRMATKMRLAVRLAGTDFHHRVKPTKYLRETLQRNIDNPDAIDSYDTDLAEYRSSPAKGAGDTPLTDPAGPYYGANYKYIVITNSSLAGLSDPYSFQALCDSKIARGISAGIVISDDVWFLANYDGTRPSGGTDHATRIRNFLIDAYETWGTEYALLGGDKDIIPVRLFRDGIDIAADLYYGCVDPPDCTFDNDADGKYGESNDGVGGGEVDLTAEIFTGRAAVETEAELINFVRKTLVYETISNNDPYLNESATMGSYLGFGGIQEFTAPFAELVRLGSSLYLGHHTHGFEDASIPDARTFNVTTLYDQDWYNDHYNPDYDPYTAGPGDGVSWNWNSMGWDALTELVPVLNGTGGNITPQLIYISDHGSWEWGMVKLKTTPTTYYACTDLSKLNNTKPFFFYDDSCNVGEINHADCFGEVITTMEHGAFACILNSRSGWGASGNTLDSPSTQLTREFFESVFGKGIFELGRAHQDAKESCIWRINSLGKLRYVYYEINLFGDPELRLRVTTGETEDLPPSSVDAGISWITWSGQGVELDATVEDDGVSALTYAWSADPAAGVVFSATDVEDPNVTITKAPGAAATVTLTLAVHDEGNPTPVEDTMTIDVYDNACQAAIGAGLAAENPTDLDGNCIINLEDFAVLAADWLVDNALTAPEPKP